ncbi:hypothetical protein INR49_026632 [Caranx melampygus]|nr:hypothetical protein INR49_026632 [Caranx melampygus]
MVNQIATAKAYLAHCTLSIRYVALRILRITTKRSAGSPIGFHFGLHCKKTHTTAKGFSSDTHL